jgi:hypothetical protein
MVATRRIAAWRLSSASVARKLSGSALFEPVSWGAAMFAHRCSWASRYVVHLMAVRPVPLIETIKRNSMIY